MSCYCKGNELIHICICCHSIPCNCNFSHKRKPLSPSSSSSSSQNPPQGTQKNLASIIAEIQKNYAKLLEQQLRKLSDRKEKQIDDLLQQVGKFKSEITRLENRNKLDRGNQNRLKQELSSKSAIIRQLQQGLNKKQQAYKTLNQQFQNYKNKDVPPQAVPLHKPAHLNMLQYQNLKDQIIKLKSTIYELEQTNKNLKEKLQRNKTHSQNIEGELRDRIDLLESQLENKNKQISNMKNQNKYLSQKIQILNRPVQHNQPIFLHKLTSQPPEINTIYVDRPVEKTKFVQIQRVVNKFIQPDRPIINRIVQCQKRKVCECDTARRSSNLYHHNDQIYQQNLKQSFSKKQRQNKSPCSCAEYEQLVDSYKNQRQRLVKAMEDRSSDYRLLQKKIQLCQKINGRSVPNNCQSIVEVTVYKDGKIQQNQHHSPNSNENKKTRGEGKQKAPIRTPGSIPNKKNQSKYKR